MIFEITPWDTLLFRNGVPMNKESSNYIESRAMPFPSVFYGSLCTALMEKGYLKKVKEKIEEVNKKINEIKDCKENQNRQMVLNEELLNLRQELSRLMERSMMIKGIYLKKNSDVYMPAPLDLFETSTGKVYCGEYNNDKGIIEIPVVNQKLSTVQGKYIKVQQYISYYLKHQYSSIKIYGESHFWNRYQKAGIELEGKKVKEGHLYFVNLLETLEGTSFVIEVEINEAIDELINEGVQWNIFLGGERRMAHLSLYEGDNSYFEILRKNEYGNEMFQHLKVIFTTPYLINKQENEIEMSSCRIVNKIVGKLEDVAGFDMALNRQKTMNQAIPAGSVFVLETNSDFNDCSMDVYEKVERILGINDKKNSMSYKGFGCFILERM